MSMKLLFLMLSSPSLSSPQLNFRANHRWDWCCRLAVHTLSNNASTFPRSRPSARSRRVWAVSCRCTHATQVHHVPERKCCGTPRTSWTSTSPPSDGQYILTYSECILMWTSIGRLYEPYWRHIAVIWINRLGMQWRYLPWMNGVPRMRRHVSVHRGVSIAP